MKIENWIANILVFISILVTGIFSWLVFRVSKVNADVAKATYQLVKQNEDKNYNIIENEKALYTLLILQNINKLSQLLIENNTYLYMLEIKKGIPFEHNLVSRYYDYSFVLKLFSIWEQLSSYSDLFILTDKIGDWTIATKPGKGEIINETRDELIKTTQLFINEVLRINKKN